MKRLVISIAATLMASSALAGTGSSSNGATSQTAVYTASGSPTVPVWATQACVTLVGGGGGGSGGAPGVTDGGGGGGAGNTVNQCAPVTGGATLTTTVGAAGTGGSSGNSGTGGGFTTISGFANGIALVAYGGSPGLMITGTSTAGVGGGSTVGSANPVAYSAIDPTGVFTGANGVVNSGASASANRCFTKAIGTTNGAGASTTGGGAGGCSMFGVGGNGGDYGATTGSVGANATGYGAGGGGGGLGGTTGGAGGNGSPGIIIVRFTQ